MLTKEEERYLRFWEDHRTVEGTTRFKLLHGLPMACLFGLPIILSVFVVQIFSPDWFAKLQGVRSAMFFIFIAVLLIILFSAYFRMHFRWERREQLYQELLAKRNRLNAAESQHLTSN